MHTVKEKELGVRKGERSFFLFVWGEVLWVTLLQGSEKASLKGGLDLGDNGMLDDEGF